MQHQRRRAFLIFFIFCGLLFIIFQSYHLHLSYLTEDYLNGYAKQQIDGAWQDFKYTCLEHKLFHKIFSENVDQLTINYFRRELSRIERSYYLQTLEIKRLDAAVVFGSEQNIINQEGAKRSESIIHEGKLIGYVHFSFSLPFESLLLFQQRYLKTGSAVIVVIMIIGLIAINSMLNHIFTLEKQYDRSRKLAEFGSISAGVAHDIRNPLAVILLQLEALKEMHESDAETQEYLNFIRKNAKRINHTISTLLVFQQENMEMTQSMDLESVVFEAIENASLKDEFNKGNIRVKLAYVRLIGNRNLMIRMVENLLRNAVESHEEEPLDISVNGYVRDSKYSLEIQDAGKGVCDIQNIFEPFFTTKNYGTGLGLQVVRDAARRHQANVRAIKNSSGGSTFIVEFDDFSSKDNAS